MIRPTLEVSLNDPLDWTSSRTMPQTSEPPIDSASQAVPDPAGLTVSSHNLRRSRQDTRRRYRRQQRAEAHDADNHNLVRFAEAVVDLVALLIVLVVILVDGIVRGDVGLDRVQAWSLAFKIVFGVVGCFSAVFGGLVRRLVVAIFVIFAFGFD